LERARVRLRKTGRLWYRFQLEPFKKELSEIQAQVDEVYNVAKGLMMKKK